jgi:pimeloyl-ACP methyl ester carboxylesterase
METALADVRPFTVHDFDATRKLVDTSFGRIAYVERGDGPAALFIHGALLNGYQWRHQLAGLSDIRRVIALDTLGMGHTELRRGQPLGLKQQAAMFKAFLDALGIADVDLVGNDSGGGAAQIFAARNPGYVRTMTLINCEVHDYDENVPAFVQFRKSFESGAFVQALRAATTRPEVGRKVMGGAYENPGNIPDEAIRAYATPLVASQDRIDQMLGYLAATTNRDLVEIAAELAEVPAPTLVLWGTADAFFPVKWAHWLEHHLPNVEEVVELEGARVFWPEERPALLNRKLRELWTRRRR